MAVARLVQVAELQALGIPQRFAKESSGRSGRSGSLARRSTRATEDWLE